MQVTMNILNTYLFAFISVIFQTNFICEAFVLDTNLGKFIHNSTNNVANEETETYRKLSKDAIVSAFNGFVQIVDDPMLIKRSTMNYNIPDIVRTEGFIETLSVSNLKNATLNHVFTSNDDSYVELGITFPSLSIAGLYNMTLHFDRHSFSVYGNGSFAVQLNDFKVRLNVTLEKTNQGYTVPSKIAWNQTLGSVNVKIDNLMEDSEASNVISENLSVVIPALHESYKPVIDDFMGQAVMIYGKMLFLNSKRDVNLEKMIGMFVQQARNVEKNAETNTRV